MNQKTASVKPAQGVELNKKTAAVNLEPIEKPETSLTVVKKKMTIAEKLDSLHKLEAMAGKVEYLRERKQALDSFGTGDDGFQGAKLILKNSFREEVTVSNPGIVEELVRIANMRVKDLLIKAEKEIEEFEII
jgi:hypothetical protein